VAVIIGTFIFQTTENDKSDSLYGTHVQLAYLKISGFILFILDLISKIALFIPSTDKS
jgi:hypothetical protein